jgi:hypothetical protein
MQHGLRWLRFNIKKAALHRPLPMEESLGGGNAAKNWRSKCYNLSANSKPGTKPHGVLLE